jgi:hypothetical protein
MQPLGRTGERMRNIEDQSNINELDHWAYRNRFKKSKGEVTLEDILKEIQSTNSWLKEILLSLKGQSNYDRAAEARALLIS